MSEPILFCEECRVVSPDIRCKHPLLAIERGSVVRNSKGRIIEVTAATLRTR